MRRISVVAADHERMSKAMAELRSIADEVDGPDGRVHWRDSRLEWPIRHGIIDLVAREFHAGKIMFPPDASLCGSRPKHATRICGVWPARQLMAPFSRVSSRETSPLM
jgi:hypothetical protein